MHDAFVASHSSEVLLNNEQEAQVSDTTGAEESIKIIKKEIHAFTKR